MNQAQKIPCRNELRQGTACRKSPLWLFLQAADFFDFIEKVPDCTRKWGLTCFSVALLEGIRTATGSPDPLSHFSPVACFAWCHFFDSLYPAGMNSG
ncbi:MAG TPA: hypothetical protein H9839_05685, partial [Candidatus Intestinimonas stercorigallinarum]|nr:hypothetical protein [Candidatus Intestinimonas stercorigallinarum]